MPHSKSSIFNSFFFLDTRLQPADICAMRHGNANGYVGFLDSDTKSTLNLEDNLADDLPCGHRQDRSPVQMTAGQDALLARAGSW